MEAGDLYSLGGASSLVCRARALEGLLSCHVSGSDRKHVKQDTLSCAGDSWAFGRSAFGYLLVHLVWYSAGEDDGFLVCYVHHEAESTTYMMVSACA
eukprot:1152509-Pelagomonas_calceolata.AAC.5